MQMFPLDPSLTHQDLVLMEQVAGLLGLAPSRLQV